MRASKHEMTADAVLQILDALQASGVECWIDGGWGVDALLGAQTRAHADLDLVVRIDDRPAVQRSLAAAGYLKRTGESDGVDDFVLVDSVGREVDVHAIAFDERGYGAFPLPDGRRWPFPPSAFRGSGRIQGRSVGCLSAEAQVQCHGQGYRPSSQDLHDMALLQEHLGVVLPVHLCPGNAVPACERTSHGSSGAPVAPSPVRISDFSPQHLDMVVRLALAAWAPVFASLESVLEPDVHRELLPDWRSSQARAVQSACADPSMKVSVALLGGEVVGFVAARLHPEAGLGEVYMVAVHPDHQRRGMGTVLLEHALSQLRALGARVGMVETGGDAGHAPARRVYEALGFRALPIRRYFRTLREVP